MNKKMKSIIREIKAAKTIYAAGIIAVSRACQANLPPEEIENSVELLFGEKRMPTLEEIEDVNKFLNIIALF